MIAACHLAPDDLVMINVADWGFADRAWGKTCAEIRELLPQYHSQYGDNWNSMYGNPALVSGMPVVDGIRYAVLSVVQPGDVFPSEILVDASQNRVMSGNNISSMGGGLTLPLTNQGKTSWLEELEPLTSWDGSQLWSNPMPAGIPATHWTVAVVAADGQLYRWQGDETVPAGFQQVYDAFQSLTRS